MMLVPRTLSGVVILSNALPLMHAPDCCAQLLLSEVMGANSQVDYLELVEKSANTQLTWYGQA